MPTSVLTVDGSSTAEVGTAGGVAAGTLTVDAGGAVYGAGRIDAAVQDSGTIDAQNKVLRITGAVTGGGTFMAEKGGTLRIDAGLSAPATLRFGDATGSFVLGGSAVPLLTETGFFGGMQVTSGGSQVQTPTKLRLMAQPVLMEPRE